MLKAITKYPKKILQRGGKFAIKVALFNSLLFSFLLAAVTYVDARLKTHVPFGTSGIGGARNYRWGYAVSGVGGLLVLLVTLFSMGAIPSRRWKLRTASPTIILLTLGAASLWFFRPDLEFPHAGIASWTVFFSLISLLSCGIHYYEFPKFLHLVLPIKIKIERVRQYASLWRTIALSITVGYLAIFIPWANYLWNIAPGFVTDISEQLKLRQFGYSLLVSGSVYVLFGIVYEAFKKVNVAGDLLLKFEAADGPTGKSIQYKEGDEKSSVKG